MRIDVTFSDGGLIEELSLVQADLNAREDLHTAMAEGVGESVRAHLLNINSRSPHTGYYAKASRSVQATADAQDGMVLIPHRGMALRYHGGRVVPVEMKNLALPTSNVPVRGEERMRPGEIPDLAYIPSRRGGVSVTTGYLVEGEEKTSKAGKKRLVPKAGGKLMFVLRGFTDHDPDPTVIPTDETLTLSATEAGEDFLQAMIQSRQNS